jgi:hypothetical protein
MIMKKLLIVGVIVAVISFALSPFAIAQMQQQNPILSTFSSTTGDGADHEDPG